MSIAIIFRGKSYEPFEPAKPLGHADTRDFARWLWSIGERGDIGWSRLATLYAEWCWMEGFEPLPGRTLQYQLGKAGIIGTRPNKGGKRVNGAKQRPTIYHVDPARKATAHISRRAA